MSARSNHTLYMRPLPASLAALDSADGRASFQRALLAGYFKFAQQLDKAGIPAFACVQP